MKVILYLQQNGLVGILNAAQGVSISELEKTVPVGLPYVIVDKDELPSDSELSYFRDALSADFDSPATPNVQIDILKAREISKNYIRGLREPLFQKNDVKIRDAMIASNTNNLRDALKERDRLRALPEIVDNIVDANNMIDLITTVE